MISIVDTYRALGDEKSLSLFNTVVSSQYDSYELQSKIKLTRKQFYSRISNLMKAGLIRRKNTVYSATTYGKLIYNCQTTVEKAIESYPKLKAIDSLEMSNELSKEEFTGIVDILIDNHEIKDRILKDRNILKAKENNLATNKIPIPKNF